ncbi:universal stress protein [Aliikangiella sp. IMCC44359]|uniref:universal stress protein n=1 Tax=Aliikangiella sp. IMCC44359 TaxID=3459125 RepID=UPI00403A9B56
MQSINSILVALDPASDNQNLLQKSIYLANVYKADIELLLVVYNPGLVTSLFFSPGEMSAAKTGYLNSQKKQVQQFEKIVKKSGVKVSSEVVWHKPHYEAIIERAKQINADLVIKATHQHKTINKVFFTPNDWQLLKSCPIPLILTKENTSDSYKQLLAAIDPNQTHNKPEALAPLVVDSAVKLSKDLSANCHVAHCYAPIEYQVWNDIGLGMGVGIGPTDFTMGEDNYSEYMAQLKSTQEQEFNDVVTPFDLDSENLHLVEGYPERLLPELVDELAIDLLVVGTAYHSGLVGSTAEKILDEVNCDVMSVQVKKG